MLAEAGYSGVGLSLDPHHFDPFAPALQQRVESLGSLLEAHKLSVAIETGASFLLDPRNKHEPTLVSIQGVERRLQLMISAISIAAELGAEVVSFWSGVVHDGADEDAVWRRLTNSCSQVVEVAAARGVQLAFEPEPGMFVDTVDRYLELRERLGNPDELGLTLDVGHVRCNEPLDEEKTIVRAADHLKYVQIDDMKDGIHEHLDFGDGEVDFDKAVGALRSIGYDGLVSVELSRHSHAAHQLIPSSFKFLSEVEMSL
jgi:L-ribulose-5-phosphate 3-epimerase